MSTADRETLFGNPKAITTGVFSTSDYLQLAHAGAPAVVAIRETLEEWFSRYCPDEPKARNDLRRRFATGDRSGFFELFLTALLLRLGYRVVIHPPIGSKRKRPDFLAMSKGMGDVAVEAVQVWEAGEEEADRRRHHLFDDLAGFDFPGLCFAIEGPHAWSTLPPRKELRGFLRRHINALDREELGTEYAKNGLNGLPRWPLPDSGIRFIPIPRTASLEGNSGFAAHIPETMRDQDLITPIRRAVLTKGNYYGNLDRPYVLALDVVRFNLSDLEVEYALFGRETAIIPQRGDGTMLPNCSRREPGGVWAPSVRSEYRSAQERVSGILTFADVNPFRMIDPKARLWLNPWAAFSYLGALQQFSQSFLSVQHTEGVRAGDILGLSSKT